MSMELAKAFCVRLMSDEDFRYSLLNVKSVDEIKNLVDAEYSFTKEEFGKVIGEVAGHKLADGELEKLIGEFVEEQSAPAEACSSILEWIGTLA